MGLQEVDENVAIFWDYENCELPATADGFTVASGIRRIAHEYGTVKVFKAYFEMSELTSSRSISLRSELQSCGVSLIDCPHNGRKDVADKMMLVDMLAHAIDNPAPSTIVLISGDRDFVYAVSILGLRKYRVVVIAPNAVHTSLKSQASAFYEWPRHVLPSEAHYDGQCNIDNGPSHRTGLPTPPDSAKDDAQATTSTSSPADWDPTRILRPTYSPLPSKPLSPMKTSSEEGRSGLEKQRDIAGAIVNDAPEVTFTVLDTSVHVDKQSSTSLAPPFATNAHDTPGESRQSPFITEASLLPPQDPKAVVFEVGSFDNVVPSVTMTRLRPPPAKFKSLVKVMERERLLGNTRVAFSQLGSMLRIEDPSIYKRAGAKQLRDYATMAEQEGVLILATSDWENGNRWTSLHPTFHGKAPESLQQIVL
ncbi:hypothetical protein PHLCEN_2v5036 [Hermanssonia centrifuga]|uniref:NYN domain-containing protein n=1 Tax=Hermanssonia centrifuga TaxID=98765 RepID=A0A2R6PC94_9APHY|nr:hypothetical protein PHLCEN_2v5036 [Hermanssonia centrifuga]